ncbi:unnamed protein product [Urochloa humidicola]
MSSSPSVAGEEGPNGLRPRLAPPPGAALLGRRRRRRLGLPSPSSPPSPDVEELEEGPAARAHLLAVRRAGLSPARRATCFSAPGMEAPPGKGEDGRGPGWEEPPRAPPSAREIRPSRGGAPVVAGSAGPAVGGGRSASLLCSARLCFCRRERRRRGRCSAVRPALPRTPAPDGRASSAGRLCSTAAGPSAPARTPVPRPASAPRPSATVAQPRRRVAPRPPPPPCSPSYGSVAATMAEREAWSSGEASRVGG